MMSEPMRKVLTLLACCSMFITPVYAETDREKANREREELKALLIANRDAINSVQPALPASSKPAKQKDTN